MEARTTPTGQHKGQRRGQGWGQRGSGHGTVSVAGVKAPPTEVGGFRSFLPNVSTETQGPDPGPAVGGASHDGPFLLPWLDPKGGSVSPPPHQDLPLDRPSPGIPRLGALRTIQRIHRPWTPRPRPAFPWRTQVPQAPSPPDALQGPSGPAARCSQTPPCRRPPCACRPHM